MNDRLDLDSYLSWMRREGDQIMHLGCRLTAAGALMAADRLVELAKEIQPNERSNMIEIKFTKTDDRAREPDQAHPGEDVGWDLHVLDDTDIDPNSFADVRSGIAIALPEGFFGRIVGRSSTIRNRGLIVIEGIIDAGFRGEQFAGVFNPSHIVRRVFEGERLCQMIVQPVVSVTWVEQQSLPGSMRGTAGFGSSGR
jgi:deoxyuridine 5'-triphosphate nucleotidohydrolase